MLGYDLDNLPISIKRPDGSVLHNGYDGAGNLISQTDGLGHATTYGYDAQERRTSVTDPLGRTTSLDRQFYLCQFLGQYRLSCERRGSIRAAPAA